GNRFLDFEGHLRRWQTNPDGFVPKEESPGVTVFPHRIPLPRLPAVALAPIVAANPIDQLAVVPTQVETAMSAPAARNIVLRFWRLPSSQRRDITLRLKLIDPAEMNLPETERYGKALVRAGERGQLP